MQQLELLPATKMQEQKVKFPVVPGLAHLRRSGSGNNSKKSAYVLQLPPMRSAQGEEAGKRKIS